MGKVAVFASDGSAVKKGSWKFYASAAFVGTILGGDNPITVSHSVSIDNGTNSIGEIYGLYMAVDAALAVQENEPDIYVVFILDSDYVLKACTKWIEGWIKKWKATGVATKANGEAVRYFNTIREIHKNLKKLKNYEILKIRSHLHPINRVHDLEIFNKENNVNEPFTLTQFKMFIALNEQCDKLATDATKHLKDGGEAMVTIKGEDDDQIFELLKKL